MPYCVAYLSEIPQNANSAPLSYSHVPETKKTYELEAQQHNNTSGGNT